MGLHGEHGGAWQWRGRVDPLRRLCHTHQHKIPVQRVLDGHQVRLHLVDADVGDDDEHYLPLPGAATHNAHRNTARAHTHAQVTPGSADPHTHTHSVSTIDSRMSALGHLMAPSWRAQAYLPERHTTPWSCGAPRQPYPHTCINILHALGNTPRTLL